jgi:16S rRNA (cytosine1402-N4)-methyltransferase
MSSATAPAPLDVLRRVLRLQALNSGSMFMERKKERHDPVMVEEILDVFQLQPGAVVADGTLGLGGHSQKLLEKIAPSGVLVGFDWDAAMMEIARDRLVTLGQTQLILINDDFRTIRETLIGLGLEANAILLDLGLNSAQIEDQNRGLSFNSEGPLDMRMARNLGEPASALLNRLSPGAIELILKDYGDERWARAIAKVIVERRKSTPLRTTTDLVECVFAAIPRAAQDKRIHPATRTFQAVRIYVNRELDGLDQALKDAAQSLALRGTLAVLSYHSGEDRIVKQTFRELAEEGFQELLRKPVQPTEAEIARNPRSRSAKLRALTRISC